MIAKDKLKHLVYGSLISLVLIALFGFIGFLVAIAVFALKEILHDYVYGRGTMEVEDFLYSAVPAVIIYIVYATWFSNLN